MRPKKFGLVELAQFLEPGQEQLVLHDAALEAGALGGAGQIERIVEVLGERLFDIDVLAGGERRADALGPPAGGGRVEIDRDRRVGEAGVAIGAPSAGRRCARPVPRACRGCGRATPARASAGRHCRAAARPRARIAISDRRCCVVPSRPVAPSMTMPIVRVVMDRLFSVRIH